MGVGGTGIWKHWWASFNWRTLELGHLYKKASTLDLPKIVNPLLLKGFWCSSSSALVSCVCGWGKETLVPMEPKLERSKFFPLLQLHDLWFWSVVLSWLYSYILPKILNLQISLIVHFEN